MELFWVLTVWIGSMYLIRLYRELSIYRKYLNQHNDIYVPSCSEILEANHLRVKLAKMIRLQFSKANIIRTKETVPVFNKQYLSGPIN